MEKKILSLCQMRDSAQFGHHEFSVIIGWCRVVTYSVLLIRLEWARLYTRWLHRSLIFPCWPNRALLVVLDRALREGRSSFKLPVPRWVYEVRHCFQYRSFPSLQPQKLKPLRLRKRMRIDTIANTVTVTKNMTKRSTASASLVPSPSP